MDWLLAASAWILPALIAITFHEAAHGWAALRLGDDTALRAGRVTFNPLRHVDPLGTVLLPAILALTQAPFLFGWAKPVPVNFGRLNHPRRDMILVALAGPGVNLLLALVAAFAFHGVPYLPDFVDEWVAENLRIAIQLNLVLAVFNMLPLPPLDGGRVAVGLLPYALAAPLARLERYGMLIVILALFVLPMIGREFGQDWSIFGWLIGGPVNYLLDLLLVASGHR